MTPFLTIEQKVQCLTDAVGDVKREIQRFLAAANVAFITGFMEARGIIDSFVGMILRQEALEGDRDLLNNIEILGGKEGKFPARRRKDPSGQIPPPILPPPIYSSLHNLRIYGNLVVHRCDPQTLERKDIRLTSTDLQVALGQIMRLIEWYFQEYPRGPHLDPLYDHLPDPILGRFAEAPPDAANFLGRTGDVAQLKQLLEEGPAKLITVLAPAGMGKTSLAARAALDVTARWHAGRGLLLWFDLKSTPSFGEISARILASLESHAQPTDVAIVQLSPSARIGQIVRGLAERQVLLVLDNFESWLDPKTRQPVDPHVTQLLEHCLARAHQSRVLLTSRAAPELSGVHTANLATHTVKALPPVEAKELLRRQGTSGPDQAFADACSRLGGNPRLLIMLAEILLKRSCPDLDQGLSRFPNLIAKQSDGLLADLWGGLSSSAQGILKTLSVLQSPAPLADLVGIAALLDPRAADAEDVIWCELVPRALIVSSNDGCAFAFEHQLIRDYAFRQWPDPSVPHQAALTYYQQSRRAEQDRDSAVATDLAIIRHALAIQDYPCAAATLTGHPFKRSMMRAGRQIELLELCQPLLSAAERLQPLMRIRTRRLAACCHGDLGDYSAALPLLELCRSELAECNDPHEVCSTLQGLCGVLRKMQQYDAAEVAGKEALAIAQQRGLVEEEAWACLELGSVNRVRNRFRDAEHLVAAGYEAAERSGKSRVRAIARISKGQILKGHADLAPAIQMLSEALELCRQIGHVRNEAQVLEMFADIARRQKRYGEAMERVNQAIDIFQRIGDRTGEGIARHCRGRILVEMGGDHAEEVTSELRRAVRFALALDHPREVASVLLSLAKVLAESATAGQALACLHTARTLHVVRMNHVEWARGGRLLKKIRTATTAAGLDWDEVERTADQQQFRLLAEATGIDQAAWQQLLNTRQSLDHSAVLDPTEPSPDANTL